MGYGSRYAKHGHSCLLMRQPYILHCMRRGASMAVVHLQASGAAGGLAGGSCSASRVHHVADFALDVGCVFVYAAKSAAHIVQPRLQLPNLALRVAP